jgi:hypothetical protein
MRQRKNIGFGKKAIVAYIFAALASSALVYFGARALQNTSTQVAAVSQPDRSVGSILVPDHNGTCIKSAFDNRTGLMTDAGTAPCVSSLPAGGNLPPNLRGFQESFRGR